MDRTLIPKDRLAAYIAELERALQKAEISNEDSKILVELAVDEAAPALAYGDDKPLGDIPAAFGVMMKRVRLSGELPLYLATVIALWLKTDGAKPDSLREKIESGFGLRFEREAIWLISERFNALPDLGLDGQSLKKAEIMKLAHRKGFDFEKIYRGCAQCTYAAVTDVSGRTDDSVFRVANAFAGGMAAMGDGACGVYSGGLMSLGMFAGRRREFFDGDQDEKDMIGQLSQKLHERFISAYGTVICHGIHKEIFGRAFHLTVPEEREAFEAAGSHSLDKCPSVVGMGCAWAAEILFEHGYIR